MKSKSLPTTLLAAFAWAAFALSAQAQALNPFQNLTNGPAYMPGEILIKFKPGATDPQLQDVVRRAGLSSARHIQTRAMKDRGDDGITDAATTRDVNDAIRDLKNHPAVEYAERNWIYQHQVVSDPNYTSGLLWGMYGLNTSPSNPYGSGAGAGWDGVTSTETVYIGIIDEGIQYNHPDLMANMWVNQAEIAGNRKDDDNNGYADDIFGWNALNNNGTIYNATYDDHGTHVAGTIGAAANTTGVIGVAGNKNVKLISGKFLGPNGGTTADAIEAIDYMVALKTHNGLNIVALNNSWGGGGFSQSLLDAIVRAANANILFVVAAGNDGMNTDTSPSYPACYDTSTAGAGYNSVISVTAIDKIGAMPSWANYGAISVDLGAPGVDILSTLNNSAYGYGSGTSMATPHVTGAIALYAIQNSGAAPADIRNALLQSTTATPSLTGKTATGGRLDIPNLLFPPSAPPTAPTGLTANQVPNATAVTLVWTDNSDNETSFKIGRWDGANSTTITVAANLTTYTDTGLIPEATYTYSIAASNAKGASANVAAPAAVTIQDIAHAAAIPKTDDMTTKGNWVGNYGIQSYDMISYKQPYPAIAITSSGLINTWAATTTDIRGLQTPNKSSRTAMGYYSVPAFTVGSFFTLDVNLADGLAHKVSLYCVDWDTTLRNQTIDVIDYSYNTIIPNASKSIISFNGGTYLVWEITGHVIFKVSNNSKAAGNSVVSGLFVDDANYVPPVPPAAPSRLTATAVSKSQINLAWTDNSNNETGFKIERSTSSNVGFSQIGAVAAGVKTSQSTGLAANTTYYYRVRATDGTLDSSYSNTASATTPRR